MQDNLYPKAFTLVCLVQEKKLILQTIFGEIVETIEMLVLHELNSIVFPAGNDTSSIWKLDAHLDFATKP